VLFFGLLALRALAVGAEAAFAVIFVLLLLDFEADFEAVFLAGFFDDFLAIELIPQKYKYQKLSNPPQTSLYRPP